MQHVLPSAVVAAALCAVAAGATAVFGLVFALDDAADLRAADAVWFLAEAAAFVLAVTGSCAVAGLLLDRATRGRPVAARIGAPIVLLPVLWLVGGPVGLEWGAVFSLYWAVFLAERGALRLLRPRA